MAYTIRIFKNQPLPKTVWQIEAALRTAIIETFTVRDWQTRDHEKHLTIELRQVRLNEAKEYCGQHAGPCVGIGAARKRPKMKYLESVDWIALHNIVNRVLDACRAKALVFSTRVDTFRVKGLIGKFLIRSPELGGRKLYHYIDGAGPHAFQPHYLFDPGSASQFGSELPYAEHDEPISPPRFDDKSKTYVVDAASAV